MNKAFKLLIHFTCAASLVSMLETGMVSAQDVITQRQIALLEKLRRPNDSWPRGDGHVVLGEPGSPLSQKGYHEPGGSFSPSPGSFGVTIWVLDPNNKVITTSDDIPMDKIHQQYTFLNNSKIPSIATETPYYNCTWSYNDLGKWDLKITDANKNGNHIEVVIRSVGPAGGPVESVIWDNNTRLMINHRWLVTPDTKPVVILTGDEQKGELLKKTSGSESVSSAEGWGFAKLGFTSGSVIIRVTDTKPVFASPLTYAKVETQFNVNLPDARFTDCMNAQVAHLMMGYIGQQTGPGEPVNYPLAWERDGAYSLNAMAKSGNLKTARELSVYFAENDFFGGFGAEGDAPGSEINVLTEVAFLLDDPEYYQWIWPHIQRKLKYIDEMMNATDNVYKNYLGPLVPYLLKGDLKRRELIAAKNEEGLVFGSMDLHLPTLYITALSYRGLIQASRLAMKVNKPEVSKACIEKAAKLKAAWAKGFGQPKYDEERNFMISVWPTWVTDKSNKVFYDKIKTNHDTLWSKGVPFERPLWTYFTFAEAHQWLFIGHPETTWEILSYFWNNQCSPGLYSFWEGNGEENSFHGWDKYRGWLNPKYVTPHYWTASELLLLQIDMLTYYDESGNEPVLVVGGGIPKQWTDKKMSVENCRTKYGIVSWNYDNNKLNVTVKGAKTKFNVRPGVNFNQDVKINVVFK